MKKGRVRLLPADFTILAYIVERFTGLSRIVVERGEDQMEFIRSLYCYGSRSLFVHVPDAIYLLVLAIGELKERDKLVCTEL